MAESIEERILRRLAGLGKPAAGAAEDVAEGVAKGLAKGGKLRNLLFGQGGISKAAKFVGKGAAAASIPTFLALAGGGAVARGAREATKDAKSIRALLADPKLLERMVNESLDTGDLNAFIEARDRERLAKLGIQSPRTMDTLRALVSGSATPRLAEGETRIGGINDTELLDDILSKARLFG